MKKASESMEAHREANLSLGRNVHEEVGGWRQGAKATKEDWAKHGKTIIETQKANNSAGQSIAAMAASKKQVAQQTRDDDMKQAQRRKDLVEEQQQLRRQQAGKVRAETANQVTDDAKRWAFESRLQSANATKSDTLRLEKDRKEDEAAFKEMQKKRRNKSKSFRQSAVKSRQALLTSRAEEATAMREEKRRLADSTRARLEEERSVRMAQVRGVQANAYLQGGDQAARATGGADPSSPIAQSFYSLTNIRPPSPTPPGTEVVAAA